MLGMLRASEDREAHDVLVGDEEEDAEDDGETYQLRDGLHSWRQGFAGDFFDDEEGEEAAVHDGDGEEVHDGEVGGDHGEEPEEPVPAAEGDDGAGVDDADGAHEVADADGALHEPAESEVELEEEVAGFGDAPAGGDRSEE